MTEVPTIWPEKSTNREKVNLQSQRAPVFASDKKCPNFRSDRKGNSSKERSRTATEEPKKRRLQSILRSNEAEQQRRKEKMKGKPYGLYGPFN
ncbi:hypothetical protein M5K25_019341 [Dendrobium thyrsiflorum]|uniref:Uncharacterized protein n=1 Tax=Dendrobium thyrsiflorum TaxID=117978 RepID=A0ABD0ULU6_DENTH